MAQPSQPAIVVIGCGAIGLPLAVALASRGASVLGIDADPARVADLTAGRTALGDSGLAEGLRTGLEEGGLGFSAVLNTAPDERAYVLAVPTPARADGAFDTGPIEAAMAAVSAAARRDELVCVRSTIPIGATRALAGAYASAGLMFAACPDRSVAGNAYAEQFSLPHVVGGLGDTAGVRAAAIFAHLGTVVRAPDPETAEAIKLFANVQRDVSFALANQFALISEAAGIDLAVVRQVGAAGFPRFSLARPGPVGGPCLTKDIALLLASAGLESVDTRLLSAARSLNESLADRIAAAVETELAERPGQAVAILGLAFKGTPPTGDQRGAFAAALCERLVGRLPKLDLRRWDPVAEPPAGRAAAVRRAGVVVLANDHPDLAIGLDAELSADAVVFDLTGLVGPGAGFASKRFGNGAAPTRS